MSSWKKAAKTGKKTYNERHQPDSRKHLGLLEKKKDYKLRAQDYNEKQEILKLLKKRVLNKNPDEFYFHMINSKVRKGIHREKDKPKEYTEEQMKLMKTQDLKYIGFKRNLEYRAIEKMQSQLHAIDAANKTPNKHIFFVDGNEEEKNFDVAKKLQTHSALLERKTNRLQLDRLKEIKLPDIDEKTLAKMEQQKHMAYTELEKRIKREKELTLVQQKLEIKNALKNKSKKPILIKEGTKDAPPIYKWSFQRKK
ncbi:probable U3 small nucleolar RNA-associated protein 11 [Chelonus insularis]|uniref:probable U3 small nucleolar RNA-associated protein 11 n=1 Tax=Chelonus insularis TaxID=460826 RepID=UPI00158D5E55|nr:probable U3 small nucleolar RNA-associated protein 11 [Chelonus insularis]